jgi:hypothetical protein
MWEYKELAPGIASYENVIDSAENFIYELENLSKDNHLSWHDATASNGGELEEPSSKPLIRDCKVISLPPYDSNPELYDETLKHYFDLHLKLNNSLYAVINDYRNRYLAGQWDKAEGWQILKYGSGNHFVNHFDDSRLYPRTVSMSFYLNDNYEGGEIEFGRFNLKIKPKANQMILFPSNYIYNHTVHPVKSGTRYAVVGWWN